MDGQTMLQLLVGMLVGVAGTVTMDILATVSRKLGLAMGANGQWVGRWYQGFARGRFVHPDITTVPEQPGEMRAALVGHYIIGITLGVLYVFGVELVGVSPASFVVSVGYGLGTCIFPWFLVFPALGFGVFGRRGPRELKVFSASVLNHLGYGLGLWWIANLLRLGQ